MTFNEYRRENSVENKIKFQGQERITDLGLGWDAFRYRNYMPDIGRFFNIDPLAESYTYNSPYAFAENKLGMGVELEGLELGPFFFFARPAPVVRPVVETMVKTNGSGRTTGTTLENAARVGRGSHSEELPKWETNENFGTEVKVGKGNRLDGMKIEQNEDGTFTGTIRELKPNTPSGRTKGLKQLERYVDAASKEHPEVTDWQPELTLYQLLAPTTNTEGSNNNSNTETTGDTSNGQSDQKKSNGQVPVKSDATRVAPAFDPTKVKTPCEYPDCV